MPETDLQTLVKKIDEKDAVIESLAEVIGKQSDTLMEMVEELKKIKIAVNGGGCNNGGIDWDERITVNEEYRKTKSPKEMLTEGLVFLSRTEDFATRYMSDKGLKQLFTNLVLRNWKMLLFIVFILFGNSVGVRLLAYIETVLGGVANGP